MSCRITGLINFVLASGVVGLVVLGGTRGGSPCSDGPGMLAGREIFEGITYGCEQLQQSAEGSGSVYWVRVDLKVPGIDLYVTPKDPTALAQGWQYRLRWVGNVVDREHLAIAINGTLFWSNSSWRPWMLGDVANSKEPLVADHVLSHMWDDAYLLWFDDQLTPHLRPSKPLTTAEFATAKWGIGGQDFWLQDGRVWCCDVRSRSPGARTAVAVDLPSKLLFLAVGTDISPRLMFQTLADLGAKDGMLLDGGSSSSMAIGKDASGVSAGTVYGGWHPVATQFGIRARRLDPGPVSFR